ncbi:DNA-binding domain-containing protein [Pseudooceanicola sp.]|uniref:HvfC/BufC N-terminal domain-containing protein n=1 Tax=Pseudooceanicola sp. TaxID=1914328 RepID=UPI00260E8665|nr:DNA-binding domain-containing protein [Pseudooceanicola sp.]MDF1853999.1 DNA-binding domain-containing protein [Pseudooceanicola sp.]
MSTQTDFRMALLDPDRPAPPNLQDGRGGAAGRRFAVYRNNVAVSLGEALETGFPTVAKLLGEQNFRGIAALFLRATPPQSPLMMTYGSGFADFLAGFAPVQHLGYLADVARLDYAMRLSYHAADAQALAPEALQTLMSGDLSVARLTLAPALRLIRSDWPLHAIWRFNHDDGPAPAPRAEAVLITRPEFDPVPWVLPPGGAVFITAILNGATLGDAFEAASTDTPEFDLSALLALLIQDQCITGMESQT